MPLDLSILQSLKDFKSTDKMPTLFIGHGSPMNAIDDNQYRRSWQELGKALPKPSAILSISAHWITHGVTKVTAMEKPKTIHDFGGFPNELYQQEYPASGSPTFANETIRMVNNPSIQSDFDWGLDHGTWSVLLPMFPKADIPVYQLSIDYSKSPQFHYDLGLQLKSLRDKGVLILGSGNIVHNLGAMNFANKTYEWAEEFDTTIKSFIDSSNHQGVIDFQRLGHVAQMAHPSYDHFIPLLYILALQEKSENVSYFNKSFDLGSISMRSLVIS
jgi:4,5-DOPA dioxygenase extradiol